MSGADREGVDDSAAKMDPVVRNVERRILLGALRQAEAIDVDDDHWRIDPAPAGRIDGVFDNADADNVDARQC